MLTPMQIKGGAAPSKAPTADGDDEDDATATPAAGTEGGEAALWWPSNDALTKRVLQLRGLIQKAIDQLQPKQEPAAHAAISAAAPSSQTAVTSAVTLAAEAGSPAVVKEAPVSAAKVKDAPGKERVSLFVEVWLFWACSVSFRCWLFLMDVGLL